MRIAKFIAHCGVCSRRDAEKLIEERKVSVDGIIIDTPALNVSVDNVIAVNGKKIELIELPRLWVYYKPVGLITTHDDPQGRKTVFDDLKGRLPHVISIGRLDVNSEGLLLLTNSGTVARFFENPKNQIERTYKVRVFGGGRPIEFYNKKIEIEGIIYKPKSIKLTQKTNMNSWYEVILTEGKNREIRKIFEYFGFEVNRLIRTDFGKYSLGKLEPRQFKEVKLDENYSR